MSACLGTSERKRKLEEESSSSEESLNVEAPKGWTTTERKRSKASDSRYDEEVYEHRSRSNYILGISSCRNITSYHYNYVLETRLMAQTRMMKTRTASTEQWQSN